MAITVGTATLWEYDTSATSRTVSYTVPADTSHLLVATLVQSITGVTYNGVALTAATSLSGLALFYLASPPTGSSLNLVVTGSVSNQKYFAAIPLSGVGSLTGAINESVGAAASLTLTGGQVGICSVWDASTAPAAAASNTKIVTTAVLSTDDWGVFTRKATTSGAQTVGSTNGDNYCAVILTVAPTSLAATGSSTSGGTMALPGHTGTNLVNTDVGNAAWVKDNLTASVGSGLTDPLGGTSYAVLTETSAAGNHRTYDTASVTIGLLYRFSVDVAPPGGGVLSRGSIRLLANSGFASVGATFNLTTRAVSDIGAGVRYGVEPLANGWTRAWIIATATSTTVNGTMILYPHSSTSYTGSASYGLAVYTASVIEEAAVTRFRAIGATGTAASSGSSALRRTKALEALGTATGGGSAILGRISPLAATGTTVSGGSALLGRITALAASGSAQSGGIASPGVVTALAAIGTAASGGSASLARVTALAAIGTAASGGSMAALAKMKTLGAIGVALSGGTATIRLVLGRPAGRVVNIADLSRILLVAASDRDITIGDDDRTIVVPADGSRSSTPL